MKERLTTDKQKIFARENPTVMSMTKEALRRHFTVMTEEINNNRRNSLAAPEEIRCC